MSHFDEKSNQNGTFFYLFDNCLGLFIIFVANNYKLNEFPAMSRKFNTKKFIKDVLNDKYALVIGNEIILNTEIEPTGDVHQDQQRTAIQSAVEVLFYSSFAAPLVLIQFSFNTVKMMAGSRHTLSCCLCNPKNNLEQAIWLEYGKNMYSAKIITKKYNR